MLFKVNVLKNEKTKKAYEKICGKKKGDGALKTYKKGDNNLEEGESSH